MVPLFTALIGLLGVLVGALITITIDRTKAKRDFLSRQLSEFYSPMHGIREEIRILSEFRLKVRNHAGKVWQDLCKNGQASGSPEISDKLLEPEREKLHDRIDYDNEQLRQKLIPAYRRMVDLFREKYWLAEPKTREHFPSLVEFVEGWDRFLSGTHSAKIFEGMPVNEDKLLPFYEEIKRTLDRLRRRVKEALD